ncbi:MAG: hypothetical protein PHY45_00535 [Rhodocyclaceae bacterium]|nr:hypothetical protein [Rhodocyclaceae bacterium]
MNAHYHFSHPHVTPSQDTIRFVADKRQCGHGRAAAPTALAEIGNSQLLHRHKKARDIQPAMAQFTAAKK